MATSNSFTAAGNGTQELVRSGSTVSYSLSGTFVATMQLVYSVTGGASWETIGQFTAAASGKYILEPRDGGTALVMWRCISYTSGTVNTSTFHVFDAESVINGSELISCTQNGVSKKFTADRMGKFSGTRTRGVVLFGDSITGSCGGPNYFNTSLIPANPPTGQPGIVTCVSWFHIANAKLGNPWKLVANLAIGGSTVTRAANGNSSQEYYPMIDRWQDVLLFDCDTVIWGPSGINDVKSNGQSGPDRVLADMQTILEGFLKNGLKVIKIGILPMAVGGGAGLGSGLDQIAVRAAIIAEKEKQLFTSFANVTYIDAFKLFTDKTHRYLAGDSTLYYDGLHPNNKGAWLIANAMYNHFSAKLLPNDQRANWKTESFFGTRVVLTSVVISNGVGVATAGSAINVYIGDKVMFTGSTSPTGLIGPYTVTAATTTTFTFNCPGLADGTATGTIRFSQCPQLYENPFFQQNTTDVQDPAGSSITAGTTSGAGSVTGTVPAGVVVNAPANCSIVSSLVARADGRGNNLRLAITTTGAVSGIYAATVATQYVATMAGTYKSQLGAQISSATAAYEFYAYCSLSDSGGESQTVYAMQSNTSCDWDTQDWGGELIFDTENKGLITPSGTGNRVNSQSWFARIDMAAAGSLTLDIGLPAVIKVS